MSCNASVVGSRLTCMGCAVLLLVLVGRSVVSASPHVAAFERFYGDQPSAEAGTLLLGELNCVACHHSDRDFNVKQAPILTEVATRNKPTYFAEYLADVHQAKPGTTMPSLFHGLSQEVREHQTNALAHYLASLHPQGPAQDYASIGGRVRGERLYESVGCAVCHGSRKADAAKLPTDKPLGNLEAKYTLPALASFLADPLHVRASGRMPSLNLSATEARDIAAYLLPQVPAKAGLIYSYYEGSWDRLPDFDRLEPKATGEAEKIDIGLKQRGDYFGLRFEGALIIDNGGEYTFHLGSDDGSRLMVNDQLVVDHDGVHGMNFKSGKVQLQPGRHVIVAEMFEAAGQEEIKLEFEGPGVDRQEISPFIVGAEPETPLESKDFQIDESLVEEGRRLFVSVGCAACHELQEQSDTKPRKSTYSAPALASLKTDVGCLSDVVPKTAADYRLTELQRESLIMALAATEQPTKLTEAQAIHQSMVRMNCYGCHQRDEIGGPLAEQLTLFQGTQPEMGDEGRLPPWLDGVGGKLTAEWLAKTLSQGAKDRPYMLTRMPNFGADNAGHLQQILEQEDRLESLESDFKSTRATKIAGWQMVGNKGFGCIKCHIFGRYQATGVQSIDMTIMSKRLRPEWFQRYVDTPQLFRRGTRMPDAWPSSDGNSLLPQILDGRNQTQIAAVWDYLKDGRRARTPAGLATGTLELIPTSEAIIYRNFIQDAGPRAIGVGYPEQFNIAFDANQLRLALAWQGAFIDASKHWQGRGQGYQGPAGQAVLKFPAATNVAILADEKVNWPTGDPRESGAKFRGYRLTEDQRPTFLYEIDGVRVEDFPNAIDSEGEAHFVRKLDFVSEQPRSDVYLLVAAGQIVEKENGWYEVDGLYRVHVDGAQVKLRQASGKQELIVSVPFDDNTAQVIQRYEW